MNHQHQDGFNRQYASTASTKRTSATVAGTSSQPLSGRPLSLANLLIQGDPTHGRPPSIASKRSYDALSSTSTSNFDTLQHQRIHHYASVDAPLAGFGGLPTTSTISATLPGPTSPTSSVYSITSTSTVSTTTTTTFPSAARTVLLPQNGHGVRTRVTILPASAAAQAANKTGGGLGTTFSKERRISSLDPAPPSSSRAAPHEASQRLCHPRVERGAGMANSQASLGLGQVKPPPRLQSVSSNHSIHRSMQNVSITSSSSSLDSTAAEPASSHNRRTVSDSTAAAAGPAIATEGYRFPAPPTASPFELSTDGVLICPNAPSTNHSKQSSRTNLANIPRSLIPGGYDFSSSTTSPSPHESHQNQYPRHLHHQTSGSASTFAYLRDRSASIPRTVSSADDDSGRNSMDYHRQQYEIPIVPELDATFMTAKQTLENGSINKGDDTGHAQLVSTFSNSSHNASSRQSTEEDHHVFAPMISPIAPQLDLDFGNSSGLSLDFGGDFGGSLGLSFGAGSSGKRKSGSLGLSFGDFGNSAIASKTFTPVLPPAVTRGNQNDGTREKNDSTATTTMSSFLSLQDSSLSTQEAELSLFLSEGALEMEMEIPPLSAMSNSTVEQREPAPQQTRKDSHSDDDAPLQQTMQAKTKSQFASGLNSTSTTSAEVNGDIGPALPSARPQFTVDANIRSESPSSINSSSSLSRPVSSLFMGNAGASENDRKRFFTNSASKGEYASDESKRITLSSTEQLPTIKTAIESGSAYHPDQIVHQNKNIRSSSYNKSLPPVPTKSPASTRTIQTFDVGRVQATSQENAFRHTSTKSQEQLGLGIPIAREALGAARRSYSEHTKSYTEERPPNYHSRSYNERNPVNYTRERPDSFVDSQGDVKTPQFGRKAEDRPSSRTYDSDTVSMHSNSTTGYTSLETTRNFGAPVAPDATRVYRSSTDSEPVIRLGRSESKRPRANTAAYLGSVKNAFENDEISAKQDVPLAKLARPKTNARNAWPGGELRKRDAITDKLLDTVTAKLDVWLTRHPERRMTLAEAEHHNRIRVSDANEIEEAQETGKLQPLTRITPPANTPMNRKSQPMAPIATRDSSQSLDFGNTSYEIKHASLASPSAVKTINLKPEAKNATMPASESRPVEPPTQVRKSETTVTEPSTKQSSDAPSSLPALTASSSLSNSTVLDSLVSTSGISELTRTPLTAVASSPSLNPTPPLRIMPKGRSETLSKAAKPQVPGGDQPWSQVWSDISEALNGYRHGLKEENQDRASLSQNGLVPNFRNQEFSALIHNRTLSNRQKELLLDWVDVLFEDLQGTPPNRGACLDGIAVIIESRLMSYFAFAPNTEGFKRYERTIASLAAFAVEKLNGKAIFANTLGFAGKMLAAAFWNLEGVGLKLLRLLPAVKKLHIARIYADTKFSECPGKFPSHLDELVFKGSPADYIKAFRPVRPGMAGDTHLYKATFESPKPKTLTSEANVDTNLKSVGTKQEINIEMAGNWLIRWTATDSDLPFAFMRAYHRQLSNYLPLYQPDSSEALSTSQLVTAPGYVFIAGTLLEVCDALIHRNLRSVTTMAPSNTGVNANESANLAAGQKPKSLEIVSKRVIQTMFELAGGALQAESPQSSPAAFASAALRHNFGCSLSMWLRAVTKRTSMWDTRGIFALLDLIEGLMYNVCCPPYEEGQDEDDQAWVPSEIGLKLFDTKFILSFIKTILSKADNTTCLLRTISFLYTEFQSFTLRVEDREELCNKVILDDEVFTRLFLYYNVGVRGYFLRLLVYRLARLGSNDDGKPPTRDHSIISTLRLFEYRLEKIRKRHDEIDPLEDDDWDSDSSDDFRPRHKRSTVCSTWGVRDKPWAMDVAKLREDVSDSEDEEHTRNDDMECVKANLQDIIEDGTEESNTTSQQENKSLNDKAPERFPRRPSASSSTNRPPSIPCPPTNAHSAKKGNVAKSAMKVWNALTHRKGPSGGLSCNKKKGNAHDTGSPVAHEVSLPFDKTDKTDLGPRRSSGSSTSGSLTTNPAAQQKKHSLEEKKAFPVQEKQAVGSTPQDPSGSIITNQTAPRDTGGSKPDFLTIEVPAPRLRKRSSHKSIRRGAANQAPTANGRLAAPATSPRSRRSSLYSFELDVETPRSDSFDLPRSPMLSTGQPQLGSGSPAVGKSGVLNLSPIAFSALLDGALNFDTLDIEDQNADKSGDRLTPAGHKRHKSMSSARNRSRPVSISSERTGPSPRVSKRFSKRASILPPQALDLLKESPSEPVPKIPEQYKGPTNCINPGDNAGSALISPNAIRAPSPDPYEQRLHPYAIRGLREYEDCLDEWELFVHRVKEEEGVDGRELAALIPRLQCAWPSTWEE